MKLRVGVIFGGESVEHEVSIITGVQAMMYMDEEKYEIIPIYITKDREWYTGNLLKNMDIYSDMELLKKYATNVVLYNKGNTFVLQKKTGVKRIVNYIDLILPVVHGTNTEDGTLQGYLELIGIPYVGSNIYSAAVGQDKVFQKQIFEASDILITKYIWFFDNEYKENESEILEKAKKLGYPLMVKPARLGSSVGISKAKDEAELKEAIEEAIKYDEKVVVEKVVENLVEVNCSVMGNYEYQETSELEEVMGTDEFLSYRDKYIGNGSKKLGVKSPSSKGMVATDRVLPARLDEKMSNQVRALAKKVFVVTNASGVVRIDFLLDKKDGKVYVNEINTIPGCLSFYLWTPINKSYKELLDDIISLAVRTYKRKKRKIFTFDSNILSNFNGSKGMKGMKGKLKM
ncbi:MAG TPA: D-alanine--D-alanine ligase family protein [Bacilli bacterium]|nr:D-alanine--D-alanine ligase family protein [Bacilli bacterium]